MEARIWRGIYSVALFAVTPFVVLHLLHRALRQPAYLQHWSERFGHYRARPAGRVVWIHAVSVGETRAAQPLVEALMRSHTDTAIVMTHMTPTGRATGEQIYGDSVCRVYLPYDYPFAVRRFLRHFKPSLGVLIETEVWPNLITAARQHGIPVALVNARLSEASFRRALRWRAVLGPAVGKLNSVLAQTDADARRLQAMGAKRVQVTGSIKFDIAPAARVLAQAVDFRRRLGNLRVFLAASTRDGEEALILDSLLRLPLPEDVLITIVPRHPQRFAAVAGLANERGLALQRRSDGEAIQPGTRVWIGDSMGELLAYYAIADVAFIGGGLLPYGTHNLIEACAMGCPVLVGVHTFNFEQAVRDAINAGAAVRVADADDLVKVATEILGDAGRRIRMAESARHFSLAHRGATERTLRELENLLSQS